MLIRGRLSDRKIEQYRKQGFYSSEYRQARKQRMKRKVFREEMNRVSSGNFFEAEDGRLIYSPI